MIAQIALWSSVAIVLYAYAGYPCALMALSWFRHRPVRKGHATPRVSFIITAHNEEARLPGKIRNTLGQDYPRDLFEVIVASDCSTDGTDAIAEAYGDRVRLVRAPRRRGKEAAQQVAVQAASGEILIFSDVATALAPDGVSTIVANFSDPSVGCVSSVDRFIDEEGRVSGEGAYVRYEMFLRSLETRVNSLVGLSGSFFAARQEVCRRWAPDRQSDFSTLLNAVEIGFRGVLDVQSAGYYTNIVNERRELERKVRTVVRGIAVLVANVRMLNPLRYGLFAWQLASHKLCRWLVPFALVVALLSNAAAASGSSFYSGLLLLQCGFYAAALAGVPTGARALKLPAFLVVANFGILLAWLRYGRGERMTTWDPSARASAVPPAGSRG
jgi:glycosyltransferase involved in cell wall biosynthesis